MRCKQVRNTTTTSLLSIDEFQNRKFLHTLIAIGMFPGGRLMRCCPVLKYQVSTLYIASIYKSRGCPYPYWTPLSTKVQYTVKRTYDSQSVRCNFVNDEKEHLNGEPSWWRNKLTKEATDIQSSIPKLFIMTALT